MRINCLPVEWLADQHLFAEFREIKMLPKALQRTLKSSKGLKISLISDKYTLNTGHGYFFYNKLGYIYKRFEELKTEVHRRGYDTSSNDILDLQISDLTHDWKPTVSDMLVSLQRITEKIMMKPEWYRYNKNKMNKQDWVEFLNLKKQRITNDN